MKIPKAWISLLIVIACIIYSIAAQATINTLGDGNCKRSGGAEKMQNTRMLNQTIKQ